MRCVIWTCAILVQLTSIALPAASESGDEDSFILEHDLGLGTFSHRGKIQLPNARRKEPEVLSQVELEDVDLDVLGSQGKGNHGLYRIKVKGHKESDNATTAMGYTDGRRLQNAGLNDVVTVFSDELGNIVSISVRPQSVVDVYGSSEFSTILLSQSPGQGPIPDTAGFLNKVREEKIKKEKSEKDPKSFIGKYWMYILPVVFLFMMSNANQQQQGS